MNPDSETTSLIQTQTGGPTYNSYSYSGPNLDIKEEEKNDPVCSTFTLRVVAAVVVLFSLTLVILAATAPSHPSRGDKY
jgi:hypothetical protein